MPQLHLPRPESGYWVFFPEPLVFPGRGVVSSSSRTTKSGVASRLRLLALAHLPGRKGVHHPSRQWDGVFPRLCPGVLSLSLEPCRKAVKSDLLELASGGWRLNPHGHLEKVRALWTSSDVSLPVGMPPHLLFILHCSPRITRWLVWPSVSFRSLELFLPLRKGDG